MSQVLSRDAYLKRPIPHFNPDHNERPRMTQNRISQVEPAHILRAVDQEPVAPPWWRRSTTVGAVAMATAPTVAGAAMSASYYLLPWVMAPWTFYAAPVVTVGATVASGRALFQPTHRVQGPATLQGSLESPAPQQGVTPTTMERICRKVFAEPHRMIEGAAQGAAVGSLIGVAVLSSIVAPPIMPMAGFATTLISAAAGATARRMAS